MDELRTLAEFLLPWVPWKPLEPLRIGFAAAIFGLTAVTVQLLQKHANEASWERNWMGAPAFGSNRQLDIDHGSVNDISLAVRTRSEAMAAAMPGVLLVVGLLGTFIGLGLALTQASILLSAEENAAAAKMSATLVEMMKGLGHKFSTSTWGIVGYLVLRSWSSLNGFEERRLRWSTGRMRSEFDATRAHRRHAADAQHAALAKLLSALVQAVKQTSTTAEESAKVRHDQETALLSGILRFIGSNAKTTEHIKTSSERTADVLQEFLGGVRRNIKQMDDSANSMARSADGSEKAATNLGKAATELRETIDRLDANVGTTLGDVRAGLAGAIDDLKFTTSSNMDRIANDLSTVTTRLEGTLDRIHSGLTTTLQGIDKSTAGSNKNISDALARLSESVNSTLTELHSTMQAAGKMSQDANAHFMANTMGILKLVETARMTVETIKADIVRSLEMAAVATEGTNKLFYKFEGISARHEAATDALVAALKSVPASGRSTKSPSRTPPKSRPLRKVRPQ